MCGSDNFSKNGVDKKLKKSSSELCSISKEMVCGDTYTALIHVCRILLLKINVKHIGISLSNTEANYII